MFEKLVELLGNIQQNGNDFRDVEMHGMRFPDTVSNEDVATYLLANGVTVHQWISVEERLPEVATTHNTKWDKSTDSIRVLCACIQKDGKKMVKEGYCKVYPDGVTHWKIPGTIHKVTHWMALPESP